MRNFRASFASVVLSVLLPWSAGAALLEMKPGDRTIEEIKIAKEATLKTPDGKSTALKTYVTGLRKKKVALFWAKVYVGQILAAEALTPPKTLDDAYGALAKSSAVAITLTFVRHVSSEQLKSAFEDSFEENGIDPKKDTGVKPLLEILKKGGDMYDKQMMAIVLTKAKDGAETLFYDNGKGDVQTASLEKGTAGKILKLWFGKPADSGVERLQKQFLGQPD